MSEPVTIEELPPNLTALLEARGLSAYLTVVRDDGEDVDVDELEAALARYDAAAVAPEPRTESAAQKPAHRCPGWVIDGAGSVFPCAVCNSLTPEEAYDAACAWVATLPDHPQHRAHDECNGCPGFDAFECPDSGIPGDYAILWFVGSGAPAGDREAQDAARAFYTQTFGDPHRTQPRP
jgi:hypothetical protein